MTPYTAVYYPHTTLRAAGLLRTSLLLWDQVDCIVPWSGFSVTAGLNPTSAQAAELVLRPRHPSALEKAQVHKAVVKAFENGVPPWVILAMTEHTGHSPSRQDEHDYLIYAQKFMPETWNELSRASVARQLPGRTRSEFRVRTAKPRTR